MENIIYRAEYYHNGTTYVVNDSFEEHMKLRSDENYLSAYIHCHINENEVIEEPTEQQHHVEEPAEQYSTQSQNSNNSNIDKENSSQDPNNFYWCPKSTKLLIESYKEKALDFRNPKIKKKEIWAQIVQIFKSHNISVNIDILDRKIRNMKKTYRTIKDNNRQTGRGRISWGYYNVFEEIFATDRSINFGPTLSSLNMPVPVAVSPPAPASPPPPAPASPPPPAPAPAPPLPAPAPAPAPPLPAPAPLLPAPPLPAPPSPPPPPASYNEEDAINDCFQNRNTEQNSPIPSTSGNRNRSLYNLRKKQLETEEKRVEALKVLSEKIEESNQIQKERNRLLEVLIRQNCNNNNNT